MYDDFYRATDVDFSFVRKIIKGLYYLSELAAAIGVFFGVSVVIRSGDCPPEMTAGEIIIAYSLAVAIGAHISYCFSIGFFEHIKNTREVRDEIVGLRSDLRRNVTLSDYLKETNHKRKDNEPTI